MNVRVKRGKPREQGKTGKTELAVLFPMQRLGIPGKRSLQRKRVEEEKREPLC